jgi:hypothetical protein
MELENCSNCKWWEPDGRIIDTRRVWECSDKKHPFEVRIRTRETMCCDFFFKPEDK